MAVDRVDGKREEGVERSIGKGGKGRDNDLPVIGGTLDCARE